MESRRSPIKADQLGQIAEMEAKRVATYLQPAPQIPKLSPREQYLDEVYNALHKGASTPLPVQQHPPSQL